MERDDPPDATMPEGRNGISTPPEPAITRYNYERIA
jgi:hypothetical protein